MDTTQRANLGKWQGLLYPVMLIAAIALIVFSLAGIATMAGWLPGVLSGNDAKVEQVGPRDAPARALAPLPVAKPETDWTPACAECAVVETIRALESGAPATGPVHTQSRS
jgi:hypothetical protein